ncbi:MULTISPECIES: SWIM zinc finger family protein [Actinoalloteichus]|uniref:SWIM zinc finger-containing protein n=1 Tax=Actinoalloteichus fjordicus TaxID=1612552 RepID=A0AAC9PSI5_9PSEU|nr:MULTISPECIES: SWIM zinc finger family protein [Actinoalloteichus]APU15037.1 SWIM zinc finger-containing protein [Actinoalloteichus fjordicus]APU21105.1 SWIM zinc finger-containing protein [Actinoalloteichus sp. GBA129-24]
MSAEFGATVWGRAWLRTVESTSVTTSNAGLPKARSLARNQAVADLTIVTGRVTAEVRVKDVGYRVEVGLPEWSGRTRAEAERLVAAAGAQRATLAPGDLPDSLEADLRRHEIDLAVHPSAQVVECSCPARAPRCVHVLAVLYALVQRIDEEPALALVLRSAHAEPAAAAPAAGANRIPLTDLDPARFYGD